MAAYFFFVFIFSFLTKCKSEARCMNQIQTQLLLQSVVSWHCGGSWRRLCLFQSEDSHAAARPRFMLQTKAESLCVLPSYDMKDRTFSFTYGTDFLTHLQLYGILCMDRFNHLNWKHLHKMNCSWQTNKKKNF